MKAETMTQLLTPAERRLEEINFMSEFAEQSLEYHLKVARMMKDKIDDLNREAFLVLKSMRGEVTE